MKFLNLAVTVSLVLATIAVANPLPNPLKERDLCLATNEICQIALPELCCNLVCRSDGGEPDIGVCT